MTELKKIPTAQLVEELSSREDELKNNLKFSEKDIDFLI